MHAIHGIEVLKPAEIGLKKTREIASSELIFGEFRTFGTTVQQPVVASRQAVGRRRSARCSFQNVRHKVNIR